MNPIISFVIVTWNAVEMIERCLESITAEAPGAEVIVIDNNSSDGTPDYVAARFPTVRVIRNNWNAGFGHACNAGAKHARGEYLFFLNPDASLEHGCIERMLCVMRQSSEIAIAGPLIRSTGGRPVSAGQPFLTLGTFCLRSVLGWHSTHVPLEVTTVDWVSGAALLIRRQSFELLKGFDDRFWMYVEDMHLCWKAKALGWRVAVVPQATVVHDHATSARNNMEQTLRSNAANTLLWFNETATQGLPGLARLLVAASLLAVGTKHCLVARSIRSMPMYVRIGWLVVTAPARLSAPKATVLDKPCYHPHADLKLH
jgi:GT2 family glycosyltransferase